ncbi:hypothetical protein [Streptomyces sp. AcE210]|uniref:hypothetical protein n=1 Tax=Streptomyces sp. AcE210 TaxID=2292703 RepID=UPI001F0C2CE1|nr:hypothetical protein [Streptomyces sp. AcE210]
MTFAQTCWPSVPDPAGLAHLAGGLAYAISLWGAGTEGKFKVFLNLTASFIAPLAAVLLIDFYLDGRSDPRRIAELYDRSRVLDWGLGGRRRGIRPLLAVHLVHRPLRRNPALAENPIHTGESVMRVSRILIPVGWVCGLARVLSAAGT